MKNNVRIAGILSLTLIYCFAICMMTNSLAHSDFYGKSASSQEQNFSTTLFCQTTQAENTVNNDNNLPGPGFKSPNGNQGLLTKTIEQIFERTYAHYTDISINFLIELRKTDFLFPFHYFY